MRETITIPMPCDYHIHLRQGEAMANYAKTASRQFGRVLAMPNTEPPICSPEAVRQYRNDILDAVPGWDVLMTFKLNRNYSEQELIAMRTHGAVAAKYYPLGVTTNSHDGVKNMEDMFPTLALMEKLDMVLCVHAEQPGAFSLDREDIFIQEALCNTVDKFPNLRIVLEHVSSASGVGFVKQSGPNVAATVTVHHLILTLDDIIGDSLKPQNFCKPIPKHGLDKKAIREAVFSGNPKFFLGTDSAPHSFEKKACLCGAAGVYSAPVAIPILIEEFEKKNKLHLLSYFTSLYGSYFYHVPCPTEMVTYVKEDWVVPDSVDGAVPLIAGGTLKWKLAH